MAPSNTLGTRGRVNGAGPNRPESVLRVRLQLMGVLFAVSGFISSFGTLGETLVVQSGCLFRLTEIIASLLYVVAGLLLCLRTRLLLGRPELLP